MLMREYSDSNELSTPSLRQILIDQLQYRSTNSPRQVAEKAHRDLGVVKCLETQKCESRYGRSEFQRKEYGSGTLHAPATLSLGEPDKDI
jgi:hypothetical protein